MPVWTIEELKKLFDKIPDTLPKDEKNKKVVENDIGWLVNICSGTIGNMMDMNRAVRLEALHAKCNVIWRSA